MSLQEEEIVGDVDHDALDVPGEEAEAPGTPLGSEEEYEDTEEQKYVRKDTIRRLPADDCMTSDFLTQYELARVLSIRASQIAANENAIGVSPDFKPRTPIRLAIEELRQGKCPIKIQRARGGDEKNVEEIAVRDLALPPGFDIDSIF